jgi:hypothetical protein
MYAMELGNPKRIYMYMSSMGTPKYGSFPLYDTFCNILSVFYKPALSCRQYVSTVILEYFVVQNISFCAK